MTGKELVFSVKDADGIGIILSSEFIAFDVGKNLVVKMEIDEKDDHLSGTADIPTDFNAATSEDVSRLQAPAGKSGSSTRDPIEMRFR